MYNSINDNNNSENDREVDLEELCDEIDALMDLMLVDGELSDGTKVWIRRTLIHLVNALAIRDE
ncbi:hypothetical protein O1O06_10855 [Grimontia hollisae]|uniref:hypothetical protein n=1 Tax=Grimontia hollisae TaxID=673 RepID=UPI00130354EC|nr:hypothetical protein [Grimontia hollisae]MDF2185269.1 hypothetical protein [Grimontia hollisae]